MMNFLYVSGGINCFVSANQIFKPGQNWPEFLRRGWSTKTSGTWTNVYILTRNAAVSLPFQSYVCLLQTHLTANRCIMMQEVILWSSYRVLNTALITTVVLSLLNQISYSKDWQVVWWKQCNHWYWWFMVTYKLTFWGTDIYADKYISHKFSNIVIDEIRFVDVICSYVQKVVTRLIPIVPVWWNREAHAYAIYTEYKWLQQILYFHLNVNYCSRHIRHGL